MAQTKIFAPDGFHFMITKSKGFYIMKDPLNGYKKHKLKDSTVSSKFVLLDYTASTAKVADSFHYTSLTMAKNYKPKVAKSTRVVVSTPSPQPPSTKIRTSSGGGY